MKFGGVDIGGTYTKIGVLGDNFVSSSFATPRDKSSLVEAIVEALAPYSLDGVGVGVPGAVGKDGSVRFMPNLGISDFSARELEDRLGTRVVLTNDANAAALGECKRSGLSDAVMLTLGTGVGSGVVLGGRIFEGINGEAAELGHMIIRAGGRKCGCGLKGCFEAYASATALIKRTREAMEKNRDSQMWELCPEINEVDARCPFDAEKLFDRAAAEVVEEYIDYLAVGVVNICNIFRPQAVIIGGGIANQGENLLGRLRDKCKSMNYGYKFAPEPQIIRAKLGDNAGMYGAIAMIDYICRGE